VALMLQRSPALTQAQIAQRLIHTARRDDFTGPTPNNAWSAGKMDAGAAFSCDPAPGPRQAEIAVSAVTDFWRGNFGS
jgi:hypothetical protein